MPNILLDNTDCDEDIAFTTPTSNHCPLLQLPTELLIEIVDALNKNYLNEKPRTDDSLLALRL